jgi:hypothetical protein
MVSPQCAPDGALQQPRAREVHPGSARAPWFVRDTFRRHFGRAFLAARGKFALDTESERRQKRRGCFRFARGCGG